MNRPTKKKLAVLVGTAVVLAGAGVAYAYWTGSGSGTGSAATGTSSTVTEVQTTVVGALKPGLAAQTLSGNFTNSSNGSIYVASVTVSIASVVKDSGAVAGTCDASDYTLTGTTMTVGAEVPVGTAQGAWTGATIAFNDKGASQDQCKLATVNLAYTSI